MEILNIIFPLSGLLVCLIVIVIMVWRSRIERNIQNINENNNEDLENPLI